jgi:pimeloyl-ACP methyl ester carboxylesterase
VALATALANTVPIASLALFEANPIGLLEQQGDGALYRDILLMSGAFEAAVDAGEHDAPSRIIDFWGRDGDFSAMPEAVKTYCRTTAGANVLDWRTAIAFRVTPAHFRTLQLPVLLVRGALANPAMVQITEVLRESLPRCRSQVVDGAGHFLISSHPAVCAASLADFLDEVA